MIASQIKMYKRIYYTLLIFSLISGCSTKKTITHNGSINNTTITALPSVALPTITATNTIQVNFVSSLGVTNSIPQSTPTSGIIIGSLTPTFINTISTLPSIPTPKSTMIPSPSPATPTPPPIFEDPRKNLAPGSYIVYWWANSWYIRGLDESSGARLVPVESPFSEAVLSPDGNRLAFLNIDKQVAVYDLVSGELTTYPNEEQNYITNIGWAPDGKKLIYTGLFDTVPGPWSKFGIYVVFLDSGETSCIIDWKGEFPMGAYLPVWSPDGRWIAFVGRLHGEYVDEKVFRLDASCIGKPETCAEKTELIGDYNAPTWSPTGVLTVWCSIEEEAGPCIINGGDTSPQLLLNEHSLTEQRLIGSMGYYWSPDSESFAFTLCSLDSADNIFSDVYVVSADGKEYKNLTSATEDEIWFRAWSLEGSYIALEKIGEYESTPDPYGGYYPLSDILIIPLSDGQIINLTNTPNEREDFTGWVVVPNRFKPGSIFKITIAGNNLNLRASPSLNETVLTQLETADIVTILEGPVEADGYTWWRMRTEDGVEGWAVDVAGWYAPVEATLTPTLTPAP